MGKSYTVTQRVYLYDSFEEEDIPEGMTAQQYAEERYCDGYGDIDDHDLMLIIEEPGRDTIVIDPVVPEDEEEDE